MKRIRVEPLPTWIETQGLVVLVDILRATSTITAALYQDALVVKPVARLEEALLFKEKGYLVAGEREGIRPEGFDLGNSPWEMKKAAGRKVVLTTTNGTRALEFVKKAKAIIAGSFLNLSAVAAFAERFSEITLLCAGTQGELSLEDFLFCGKLIQEIKEAEIVNDAATVAKQYAESIKDIESAFFSSRHAQKLTELGFKDDVIFCSKLNTCPIIPLLTKEGFVAIRGLCE